MALSAQPQADERRTLNADRRLFWSRRQSEASLKFSFLLTYKGKPEVVVPSDDTLQFRLGDS